MYSSVHLRVLLYFAVTYYVCLMLFSIKIPEIMEIFCTLAFMKSTRCVESFPSY